MVEKWLVRDWMSANVYTLGPEDHLVDAFELMRIHRIRHVPIISGGRLVGIISDRDIRQALPRRRAGKSVSEAGYGKTLLRVRIAAAMTAAPLTIDPGASIREAAEIICREKIGALPVVSEGRLTGIISAEDLLWAFVENTAMVPE